VSPEERRPCPAMACMGSWRIQAAVVLVVLFWLPAAAQSLGDVARAERERQSKIQHRAPLLTDEDLNRDKILQRTPRDTDSAVRSGDNSAAVSEALPLGDYARALRQRRAAEQASAPNPGAKPAIESAPAGSNPVALTPPLQPGVALPAQNGVSLGDVARQTRRERDAARLTRSREGTPQPAAQGNHGVSPVESAQRPDPGAKPNGGVKSIRVPRGGSLWRLAQEYLGSGRLWPALWKANPQVRDPNRIRAGQVLHCPGLREVQSSDSVRSARLRQPNSGGASPAAQGSATVQVTGEAGQLTPTKTGIRSGERLRKSLLSRALSR